MYASYKECKGELAHHIGKLNTDATYVHIFIYLNIDLTCLALYHINLYYIIVILFIRDLYILITFS